MTTSDELPDELPKEEHVLYGNHSAPTTVWDLQQQVLSPEEIEAAKRLYADHMSDYWAARVHGIFVDEPHMAKPPQHVNARCLTLDSIDPRPAPPSNKLGGRV